MKNIYSLLIALKNKKNGFELVAAACIFFGVMASSKDFAAGVTVTAPSLTVYACGGSFATAYTTLGDIVIKETVNSDFAITATTKTLILTAPANFVFQANTGLITATGGNVSISSYTITAATITINFTVGATNKIDILTISGLKISGTNSATGPSNILRTSANPGTATIAGITNGVTNFGTLT